MFLPPPFSHFHSWGGKNVSHMGGGLVQTDAKTNIWLLAEGTYAVDADTGMVFLQYLKWCLF